MKKAIDIICEYDKLKEESTQVKETLKQYFPEINFHKERKNPGHSPRKHLVPLERFLQNMDRFRKEIKATIPDINEIKWAFHFLSLVTQSDSAMELDIFKQKASFEMASPYISRQAYYLINRIEEKRHPLRNVDADK